MVTPDDTAVFSSPAAASSYAPSETPAPSSESVYSRGMAPGLVEAMRGYSGGGEAEVKTIAKAQRDIDSAKIPEPPKLEKPPVTTPTGFMEMFGSAAMGLAGIGSLFTRHAMTNALKSGGEVMQAFHKNDIEAAQQAYKKWEMDTDYATKMYNFERDAYRDIIEKGKTNIELGKAMMTAKAAAFKDQVVLSYLNRGDWKGALAIHEGRDPLAASMASARHQMEQFKFKEELSKRAEVNRIMAIQDPAEKAQAMQAFQEKQRLIEHAGDLPPKGSAARNADYTTADGAKGSGAVQQQADGRWTTADGIPVTPTRFTGTAAEKPKNTAITTLVDDRVAQMEQQTGRPATDAEKAQVRLDVENEQRSPAGFTPPTMVAVAGEDGKTKQYKLAQQNKTTGQWVTADEKRAPVEGVVSVAKHGETPPADDPSVKETAKAIAEYRLPPLSSFVLTKPWGHAVMAAVMAANPDYNAPRYNEINKAVSAFATGPQGNTVRALNVATEHLGTLGGLVDAMDRGDVTVINRAKNAFTQQFGDTAPTNFAAAKRIVADELVKAIMGGGGAGALADREAMEKTMDAALSWGQLHAVIQQYQELMGGQLVGLRTQYSDATGRNDFDQKLTSAARDFMSQARGAKTPAVARPADGASSTEQQAKSAFGSYEPDVYEYGTNPATGKFGRRKKD